MFQIVWLLFMLNYVLILLLMTCNLFYNFVLFFSISDPVQRFYRLNNPPQPSESLEASQVCSFLYIFLSPSCFYWHNLYFYLKQLLVNKYINHRTCIKVKSYEPSGPLLPELIPVSIAHVYATKIMSVCLHVSCLATGLLIHYNYNKFITST